MEINEIGQSGTPESRPRILLGQHNREQFRRRGDRGSIQPAHPAAHRNNPRERTGMMLLPDGVRPRDV